VGVVITIEFAVILLFVTKVLALERDTLLACPAPDNETNPVAVRPDTVVEPVTFRAFWTVRPDTVAEPVTLRPVETPNPAPVRVTPALDRVEDRAPFAAD
jgi:hypothetical protein